MYSPTAQPVLDQRFKLAFSEQCRASEAALKTAKVSWLAVQDDLTAFIQTTAHEQDRKNYADIYTEAKLVVEKEDGKLRKRLQRKLRNESDVEVTLRHEKAVALEFYPRLIKEIVRELDVNLACREARQSRQERLMCGEKTLECRERALNRLRECHDCMDSVRGEKPEMYREWVSMEDEVLALLKGCKGIGSGKSIALGEKSDGVVSGETEKSLQELRTAKEQLMKELETSRGFTTILEGEEKAMAEHVKFLLEMDINRIFYNERLKAGGRDLA